MIWRVRTKRVMDSLKASPLQVRCGSLSMRYISVDTEYPRVSFALSKRFGNSVLRHRGKRRLLEAFRQAYESVPSEKMPVGAFMITASPKVLDEPFSLIVKQTSSCFKKLEELA